MNTRHIKQTIGLSIPMIVGQIGQLTMNVADNVMVGRVGADALAAAAIGNGLFTLSMVSGIGISMAITPLTAIAMGAGRNEDCGIVLRQGLIVNMAAGLLLCLATIAGAQGIRFLNQPEAIVEPAIRYMEVLGLSMIPLMLFQSYRQFAEGLSYLRPAMIITLAANLVNIFVNWVFIFGNMGAPALGVTGAGLATFSSRIFMAACMMFIIMKAPSLKRFDPSLRYKKIDIALMKRLLAIGIPGACQYFFEVSAFVGASVIVGWMGVRELAAHQIALSLASISFMCAMGISGAGTIRVGNALGRGVKPDVRAAGFTAVILCMIFMALAGLLFVLFRNILPTLYVSEPEVIQITAGLLVIVAFFQLSDGAQAVGIGILRGITDMKVPTLLTLAAYWIIGLPVAYALAFWADMGIYGVWIGLLLSLTVSALLMALRFHVKTRI
ncbi:MAG TPA: MATE family efflux transporter [Desulfobacteraceae bacterium]|nr:MATE family efflux transporter [Desulfobacteraceae bacterium]